MQIVVWLSFIRDLFTIANKKEILFRNLFLVFEKAAMQRVSSRNIFHWLLSNKVDLGTLKPDEQF